MNRRKNESWDVEQQQKLTVKLLHVIKLIAILMALFSGIAAGFAVYYSV